MGYLACPARFERATYALEEIVAIQKTSNFNGLHCINATVQWVLLGKPTFSWVSNKDTSLASPLINTFYLNSLYVTRSIY